MRLLLLTMSLVCALHAAPPKVSTSGVSKKPHHPLSIRTQPVKAVPLKVEGDTVVIIKSLPCTITAPLGADLYSWQYPSGVEATAVENVLKITKASNGNHKISVTSVTIEIDFDKKSKKVIRDTGETTITIGSLPKPPDPPEPPTPDISELAKVFRDAAAGDKDNLKRLAAFYAESGLYLDVDANNTSRKLRDKMREGAIKMVPADKLVAVRERIADLYAKEVSIPEDQVFTFDNRNVIRGLFKKIAKALEEASK